MAAVLNVETGAEVLAQGRRYRITRVLSLEEVLALDLETGEVRRVPVRGIAPPATTPR